jgi:hypothetical protein
MLSRLGRRLRACHPPKYNPEGRNEKVGRAVQSWQNLLCPYKGIKKERGEEGES